MIRSPFLNLGFTLSLLALAGCSDNTDPTPAATAADPSPGTISFDLARNAWSPRAHLPDATPRLGLAAGVVNNADGQPILYLLGGFFDDFVLTQIYAYNYSKNAWTPRNAGLVGSYTNGVGRIGGKLYVSGGYRGGREGFCCDATLRTLYAYDPVADRMTRKADMPLATAEGVSGAIDGRLYVLVGTCVDESPPFDCDEFSGSSHRFFRYDPATNTWATLPPSPHEHSHGAAGVIKGKFYVAGGGNQVNRRLDVYDPVTNKWTSLADLPEARVGTAGVVLQSKLYVIGGQGPSGTKAVYAYDPVTNTWKTRASLNVGGIDLAAAPLVTTFGNPKILAVGGSDGTQTEGPGANELYTP